MPGYEKLMLAGANLEVVTLTPFTVSTFLGLTFLFTFTGGTFPVLEVSRLLLGLSSLEHLLLVTLDLLRVSVEVEIGHDIPGLRAHEDTTDAENLTGKKPPDKTDGVSGLVVGWDDNIDEADWGVGVADSNGGEVHVGSLTDGLVILVRVGDDEETWLLESLLDLVGESTRGVASSDGGSTNVLGELEDSALTEVTVGDSANVLWVWDSSDDTGSENKLLPCLGNVDDVDTIAAAAVHVLGHVVVAVLGTKVGSSHDELLQVISGGLEGLQTVRHLEI